MAKTVTYDTLSLLGTNAWIDVSAQEVRLEAHFSLSAASGEAPVIEKHREVQHLLSQADREITSRLRQALEGEELN
jgi:hypothetical protein